MRPEKRNTLSTVTYYEASDGKRFPKDDLERAEIYQQHLNDMDKVETIYLEAIKNLTKRPSENSMVDDETPRQTNQ